MEMPVEVFFSITPLQVTSVFKPCKWPLAIYGLERIQPHTLMDTTWYQMDIATSLFYGQYLLEIIWIVCIRGG